MSEKNDNKVELTVITLSGNYTDDFNIHQTPQHVMDMTFNKLHITPAAGEVWVLTYNVTELNPIQTIEAAHLPSGAQLHLARKEGGGGSWIER